MALGTAPRRISPGVWKTRLGETLTPAQAKVWENYFRTGRTDGKGHMRTPSVVQNPPKPVMSTPGVPVAKATQRTGSEKAPHVSFKQVWKGETPKGDYQTHRKQVAQGQAEAQLARDRKMFGGALPAVYGAPKVVDPAAAAILESLGSPANLAPHIWEAVKTGRVHPLPILGDAAMLFPFGRFAKGAKEALLAGKTAKEAEAAAKAAEIPGPESYITDALDAAKQARAQQSAGYSAERARRLKAYKEAYHSAGGGPAGHEAGLVELQGELPKVRFDDLTGLTETDMKQLFHSVDTNPLLDDWETLRLHEALRKAQQGITPQDNEIALMRKAFGVDKATEFANTGMAGKIGRTALDVANIPRSLMSSADVSAVLRQSLVASMHRPGVAAKNIGPMFHMMFSQRFYDESMAAIHADPRFAIAVRDDGLKMTDVAAPSIAHHEEAFPSNLAERIPVAGRVVKGSERAYTGFINVMRWHVYTELLGLAEEGGALTPKLRRDAARVANWATGRGELPGKALESAAPLLNTVFFSPRLMASRFQTFNPFFYGSLDPVARKYAMKAAVKTFIAGMSVLGAAAAAGAKVNSDPTSADFGKMKIGNTRVDVWGGHQQWARLAGQLAEGKITSSTTGKTINLVGGFKGSSRWDVAQRFFIGKFSPPASLVTDWAKNTDFQGRPFSWKREMLSRSYPLMVQDMLDTYRMYGIGPAVAAYGVGSFGVGIQTYGPKKPKAKPATYKDPVTGRGSYSDPWADVTSGSSSYTDPWAEYAGK